MTSRRKGLIAEGRVGLLRAECKDLEREGTEGCGAQTGRVNFEKKNNTFASRREGLRVRRRVSCDAHIGVANSQKSSWVKARNAA